MDIIKRHGEPSNLDDHKIGTVCMIPRKDTSIDFYQMTKHGWDYCGIFLSLEEFESYIDAKNPTP